MNFCMIQWVKFRLAKERERYFLKEQSWPAYPFLNILLLGLLKTLVSAVATVVLQNPSGDGFLGDCFLHLLSFATVLCLLPVERWCLEKITAFLMGSVVCVMSPQATVAYEGVVHGREGQPLYSRSLSNLQSPRSR